MRLSFSSAASTRLLRHLAIALIGMATLGGCAYGPDGGVQGNRTSKQCQKLDQIGIVPTGSLELAAQGAFGCILLHGVQRHVAEDGQVVRAVAQSGSVL